MFMTSGTVDGGVQYCSSGLETVTNLYVWTHH